jgi:response regulator RpfG family c-di-GMP phosphodiesterase
MNGPAAQLLFVDDDPNILDMLERMLSQHSEPWKTHYCLSVDEALEVLDAVEVDTLVTDVRMPVKDGFELLTAVRASQRTERVPVIILTGDCDTKLKRKALDLGATDLLNKPINREDLLARIRSALRLKSYEDQIAGQVETLDQMVKARTKELEAAQREVVWRLAKACEYRDDETGNHIVRVAWYSRILAQGLGMDGQFLDLLFLASPLHDVGKIGIPDSILLKNGKLTRDERKVIEQHTVMGSSILSEEPRSMRIYGLNSTTHLFPASETRQHDLLSMASSIARGHHEKWDGSGYPDHLFGDYIPLESRIVAVADVYDALRGERPYKPTFPEEKSVAIIREESGHHFDPTIVEAFSQRLEEIHAVDTQFQDAAALELPEV